MKEDHASNAILELFGEWLNHRFSKTVPDRCDFLESLVLDICVDSIDAFRVVDACLDLPWTVARQRGRVRLMARLSRGAG